MSVSSFLGRQVKPQSGHWISKEADYYQCLKWYPGRPNYTPLNLVYQVSAPLYAGLGISVEKRNDDRCHSPCHLFAQHRVRAQPLMITYLLDSWVYTWTKYLTQKNSVFFQLNITPMSYTYTTITRILTIDRNKDSNLQLWRIHYDIVKCNLQILITS